MLRLIVLLCLTCLCKLVTAEELRIYTIEEPPFNFTDAQGNLTGISVDYVCEIQRRLKNDSPIQLMHWARAYEIAQKEKNVILFTAARAKYREPLFRWVAAVARNAWRFYTVNNQLLPLEDLNALKSVTGIGVLRSGARQAYLQERGFENIVSTKSLIQLNKMLDKGRLPVIFFAEAGLATMSRKYKIDVEKFNSIYTVYPPASFILMSKPSNEALFERWKETAEDIKADGTYEKIASKWVRYLKDKEGVTAHFSSGTLNLWEEQPQSLD